MKEYFVRTKDFPFIDMMIVPIFVCSNVNCIAFYKNIFVVAFTANIKYDCLRASSRYTNIFEYSISVALQIIAPNMKKKSNMVA